MKNNKWKNRCTCILADAFAIVAGILLIPVCVLYLLVCTIWKIVKR
jgi:hypothetical protein